MDLSALGEFIIVPLRRGGYAWAMGTSYSVPIVARVAALVLSTNPNLTAEQLERIFFGSANDLSPPGRDPRHGHGMPNSVRAMQLTLGLPVDSRADYVEHYLCEPKNRPVSVVMPVWDLIEDSSTVHRLKLTTWGEVDTSELSW
jgi:subtilisin family serine protease